jgi:cytochrome P450
MTDTLDINFFDTETNACPYPAYEQLREQAPVWKDPHTGMFVITRYEDLKAILSNPELFTNQVGSAAGNRDRS